jgi:hypothetical protein
VLRLTSATSGQLQPLFRELKGTLSFLGKSAKPLKLSPTGGLAEIYADDLPTIYCQVLFAS